MKKLSVKNKLIGSYICILLLMLTVSWISILSLGDADEELNNYSDGPVVVQKELLTAAVSTNVGARAVRDMYISEDPSKIASYEIILNQQIEKIGYSLGIVEASGIVDPVIFNDYKLSLTKWFEIGLEVVSDIKGGRMEEAQYSLVFDCTPTLEEAVAKRTIVSDYVAKIEEETIVTSSRRNNYSALFAIGLLTIATIFGIFVMIRLIKDILVPIKEIKTSMLAMENGDLHYKSKFQSEDEFGELCDSVRKSSHKLGTYIDEINRAMHELSDGNFNIKAEFEFAGDFKNIQTSILSFSSTMSNTLEQIGTASDQVSVGSNQVAVGAQTLAQGSTEQASTVEELSDSIEKITNEIQANSENANIASKIALDMGKEIEISNKQMQSTVNAMQDINEKSSEISKIVKIIDDIAFQTNILALNAAVEAARAGVAGKGFAVVADEVRNLASKSSEAANNITLLIGASIQSVNQGNEVATKAAAALEGVVKNAEEVIIKIDDIAAASRIQAEATEKINLGITQISSVVQSISATAEESAAASEELASQSSMLNSLLSNFTLVGSNKKHNPKQKSKQVEDDYYEDDYNDKY